MGLQFQSPKNIKPEKVFAILILVFGAVLTFLTPPFETPDEFNHFSRAYQVSEGVFRGPHKEGTRSNGENVNFIYADLPNTFLRELENPNVAHTKNYHSPEKMYALMTTPLDAENTVELFIPNTGTYSPLVYAPQAFMAFLARNIFGTVGAVFYAARLGAVIFSALCIFLTLKLLPEKKLLIVVMAFSPMMLFLTASCSADAVINPLSFLAAAYLLSLRKTNARISARELFFLALAAVVLGLSKQIYGTILILYLLIPAERFGGRKYFWLYGAGVLAIYLISALGWIQLAKSGADISPALSDEANIALQLEFMKSSPVTFLLICAATVLDSWFNWYREFIGVLGWLAIILPLWFYILYPVVLVIAGLSGNLNLKFYQRILMLVTVIPTLAVMFVYFYTTWTPVQNGIVWGIQGRYFIPLGFVVLCGFSCFKNPYENFIACATITASFAVTTCEIFNHFYR